MPRETFKPLTAEEQKAIRFYLRAGATEDQIPLVERQARLKRGTGSGLLRRKHVQEEIARRKAVLEMEQARLDAQDINRKEIEEDKRQSVTLDLIEGCLRKVLDLDATTHGNIVLEGIRIGLVYTGTIQNGNMKRVIPADPTLDANKTAGTDQSFYRSIFNGLRAGELSTDAAPIMPDEAPAALNPEASLDALPVLRTKPRAAAAPAPEFSVSEIVQKSKSKRPKADIEIT